MDIKLPTASITLTRVCDEIPALRAWYWWKTAIPQRAASVMHQSISSNN